MHFFNNDLKNNFANFLLEIINKNSTIKEIKLLFNQIDHLLLVKINKILEKNRETQKKNIVPHLRAVTLDHSISPEAYKKAEKDLEEMQKKCQIEKNKYLLKEREYKRCIMRESLKNSETYEAEKSEGKTIEENNFFITLNEEKIDGEISSLKEKIEHDQNLIAETASKISEIQDQRKIYCSKKNSIRNKEKSDRKRNHI